ncbi:glycosyltransferase [Actinokineospora xionganensis]|uniref:Glycosyltransferase n=1 Tax=Actinokineospora xionganensis TaxID=2684470 RepID=A0ABR7L5Q0_9PSEU|nr:glycosyltransferase [Actinokineospora xionganensis]MBC6447995.1 glycosyltransferase [Actinokineospora xionganensis]
MRVLQIHNRYATPGGEDRVADDEAALLAAAGHEVVRVRGDNPGGGAAAVATLAGAVWNPRRFHDIRALVRADRPDVAHVHNTWFGLSPSTVDALHAEGVPVVMTLHNYRLLCANGLLYRDGAPCTDCLGAKPWPAVTHRCYRGSAAQSAVAAATIAASRHRGTWRRVTRFIAPSESIKAIHVDAGFDPARIIVKPHGVPDPGPRPTPPGHSSTVLSVGRLSAEKGLETLLAAWRTAATSLGDQKLVIVGDGPLRQRLEQNAPPRTSFTGWVSPARLSELMLSSRALVFPTRWYETFGRVAVEAMAAGMPVLASDISGPAEIAGRLGPEWLVPPGDEQAWATALGRLTDGPSITAAGAKGRAIFEREYGEAGGLRALLDAYSEATTAARAKTQWTKGSRP